MEKSFRFFYRFFTRFLSIFWSAELIKFIKNTSVIAIEPSLAIIGKTIFRICSLARGMENVSCRFIGLECDRFFFWSRRNQRVTEGSYLLSSPFHHLIILLSSEPLLTDFRCISSNFTLSRRISLSYLI